MAEQEIQEEIEIEDNDESEDDSENESTSGYSAAFEIEDFDEFKILLEESQAADTDQRELARECLLFTTKVDGQWETKVAQTFTELDRPMYTFDRTTPLIDQIVGKMEQTEFSPKVYADGDGADSKIAEIRNGMIRADMNRSDAQFLIKRVGRKLCHTGFDCLRLRHDYVDDESFDQSLLIESIPNAIDRVWFDKNSEKQDRSDAEWVVVLQSISRSKFYKEFGKDTPFPAAVSEARDSNAYEENRNDQTIIGEVLFKKYRDEEIILLSNGEVVDEDDLEEELKKYAEMGVPVKEEKRRKTKECRVFSRMFSSNGWLEKEEITAFTMLNVIPFYHCFDIIEDKIVWRRIVEKLMDAQRVLNYAKSRQIEQGALSPVEKTAITIDQLEGVADAMATLNVSNDPLFVYNHVDGQQAPFKMQGPQINQSLMMISQDAAADIEGIAGMYAASLAKNPLQQSGVALEIQTERGDMGNTSFFIDLAKGMTYMCQVMNSAYDIIHDTENKKVQTQYEDGSSEFIEVNKSKMNPETKKMEKENDMGKGKYSVICRLGPMFTTRRGETRAGLLDLYSVLPAAAEMTSDLFANTIDSPGMDQATERLRMNLVAAGQIPENQMTAEEKAAIEQANQAMAAQQQQAQGQGSGDPVQQMVEGRLTIDQFKAQTDAQLKAKDQEIEMLKLEIEKPLKEAQARKANAEAEAQELETDMTETGVMKHLNEVSGDGQAIGNIGQD